MFLWIILVPVLLLLLFLLVPIDLEGRAVPGTRPALSIAWLFGLIRMDLFPESEAEKEDYQEESGQSQRSEPAEALPEGAGIKPEKEPRIEEQIERKGKEEDKRERKSQDWSAREVLSVIQTEGLLGNLMRLLKSLTHSISIRYIRGRLRIGLEDPADTGQAAGLLWAVCGYLNSLSSVDVEIEPSFSEEVLEEEGEGSLCIWPILIVLPLLRFSFSRPALVAAWRIAGITMKRAENEKSREWKKAGNEDGGG